VQGEGFRVQGSGCRVHGSWYRGYDLEEAGRDQGPYCPTFDPPGEDHSFRANLPTGVADADFADVHPGPLTLQVGQYGRKRWSSFRLLLPPSSL